MTNSVLMFVPFSVRMRAGGYELDRKQWVPAAVKKARVEERAKIAAAVARRKEAIRILGSIPRVADVNWYTLIRAEEEAFEAKFVAMTNDEWRTWQSNDIQTWRTRAQRLSGLAFWDRINDLRRPPQQRAVVIPAPSRVDALLCERREILEFPQGNGFSSVAEQEAAVAEIEAKINAGSGRWRLGAAKIEEEQARVMRVAEHNLDSVLAIQREWRKAIQRRAMYVLGARFGIY